MIPNYPHTNAVKIAPLPLAAALAMFCLSAVYAEDSWVPDAPAAPQRTADMQPTVAAPFRGKSAVLGWRLSGLFVAGMSEKLAGQTYDVRFLDTELPMAQSVARAQAGQPNPNHSLLVGPFQRARSEAWRQALNSAGIDQMAFAAREPGSGTPRYTLALDPAATASALSEYLCRTSQSRTWALMVPQSSSGERFARSFALGTARCPQAVLGAVTWYREDLEDLSVRAREHYGIDRVPPEQLERQKLAADAVEGVLQSDVNVVIATPDSLPRVINELVYQGSSFQVFAGDFNFAHSRVLGEIKWSVPPVFLDHYPRDSRLTARSEFQSFLTASQRFMKGVPTTADLLLYEAGQLAAVQAISAPAGLSFDTAGGTVASSGEGSFILPLYPLTVSDGAIRPAHDGLIDELVSRQREQYQKFKQARTDARNAKSKPVAD